ncbi:MAG: phosphatidate cytidylyltransferase [Aerococcus sp.]|nr:phosphatidate cytidylyltransferase [Aerococcus sp.]
MKERTLTSIVALAIFLPFLYIGGLPFTLFVLLISVISFYEWVRLFKIPLFSLESGIGLVILLLLLAPHLVPSVMLPIILPLASSSWLYYIGSLLLMVLFILNPKRYTYPQMLSLGFGALYLGFGYRYLIETRALGPLAIIYILLIVYTNDSFAYLVGRRFGRHKLAPLVSTNKTIEGAVGGIIGAVIVTSILTLMLSLDKPLIVALCENMLFTIVLAIAGQLGDLLESGIKRYCGVKNSGELLPGHGGLLDRFDSMLLVLPVFHFIIMFWR